MTIHL